MTPEDARRIANLWTAALQYIKRGWTQGENTRDANGYDTRETGEPAACWCVEGALNAAIQASDNANWRADRQRYFHPALYELKQTIGMPHVAWNDTPGRTQGEVVFAIRRTIARLRNLPKE